MLFPELGLAQPLLRAVDSAGYQIPTPIQVEAIPPILAGRDLWGCAQTGTGKTAAFALPILHRLTNHASQKDRACSTTPRPIRVLVLSPTRELAVQIGENFGMLGRYLPLRRSVIHGGVSQHPQVRALKQGVDVVVATPGRLLDLMNQSCVHLGHVEICVLDEADRMMDMGFLPDVRRIVAALPRQRQTLLFSATMPPEIERMAQRMLRDPIEIRLGRQAEDRPKIEQRVLAVAQGDKARQLARLLVLPTVTRSIVFSRTKHGADRLAKILHRQGIRAEAIHGNKSQNARQRTLDNFRTNRTRVLVATDLASRGIDVDGVSHVINYDLPVDAETYVHRIGRTGRAGMAGTAISLCNDEELRGLRAIEKLMQCRLTVERSGAERPNQVNRSARAPRQSVA